MRRVTGLALVLIGTVLLAALVYAVNVVRFAPADYAPDPPGFWATITLAVLGWLVAGTGALALGCWLMHDHPAPHPPTPPPPAE